MITIQNITLHTDCTEVTLCQFFDFIKSETKFYQADAEENEIYLIETLRHIIKIPNDLQLGNPQDEINLLSDNPKLTAWSIYYHYLALFNNYLDTQVERLREGLNINELTDEEKAILADLEKPIPLEYKMKLILVSFEHMTRSHSGNESFKFKHKNKIFVIGALEAKRIYTSDDRITVGEATHVKKIRSIVRKKIEDAGDEDGTLAFNLSLEEIAVLARRPREKLPTDRSDLDQFIAERMKLFGDIPLHVYFNICFFLILLLQTSLKETIIDTYSETAKNSKINSKNGKAAKRKVSRRNQSARKNLSFSDN